LVNHEEVVTKAELNVFFDICFTDNEVVPNHWHGHLEILYILEGSMDIKCNEKGYRLEQGGMFVFNSGDIHYTHSAPRTRVILLQVPYEFLNRVIPQFDEVVFEGYFPKVRMEEELPKVKENLLYMKELYEGNEDGYSLLFHSSLSCLLYELYKNYSQRKKGQAEREDKNVNRLKEIITYIEKHYAEPISLSDVSEKFALNSEYFCRYFKRNMGFTFLEYVNMVRLPHIYEDLLRTKDNISEIQERHGFTNNKVFHRMFKKVYGCTPTEARKKIKV